MGTSGRAAWSLAAAIVMTAALSGCFGRGGGDADSNAISAWMFPQGDDEVAIRAIEAAFEAQNEGKDLEVIVYPEDEYQTKINTALVAGSPPDVAMIENRNWMKVGYVVELTEYLDDWGVSIDDFSPGGLARGAVEADPTDGVYGIGTFLGGFPIVYNKALFDAANLDYPSLDESMTFAEYADLCRQLVQPSDDPTQTVYGCTMTPDPYNYYPIYGPDGRTAQGHMNAPELAEAFEIGAALENEGVAPGGGILETITTTDLFAQGMVAMTFSDFSAVPTYQEAELNFGMAPMIVAEGQEDFVDTWTAPWGTFTESPHPEDALAFLEFVATEGQRVQMEATPDPPLSVTIAEEEGYGDDDPIKAEFLQVLENARAGVFVPPGEENWDPAEVLRLLTVEGQTDAQPILDEMAAAAQADLETVWARWETLDQSEFDEQVEEELASASAAPSAEE
jgi:multiple sugar transport system substrate-binding protein